MPDDVTTLALAGDLASLVRIVGAMMYRLESLEHVLALVIVALKERETEDAELQPPTV